jgi:hypothetical protein
MRNKYYSKRSLYSKLSGWGNVCYIVNFPPGECLLYSKVSGWKVYYIANIPRENVYYIVNIPGEGLLCGRIVNVPPWGEGLLCSKSSGGLIYRGGRFTL